MMMNSRSPVLRISADDVIDWGMETTSGRVQEYGSSEGGIVEIHDDLLIGRFEGYSLRLGLDLLMLDLSVRQDTQILAEVDQPRAGLTMIFEGYCTRKAFDHKGRETEGSARTHDNVATANYPETWSLTLKGGQSHRMIKLRLAKEHVPELIAGYETELAEPVRRILMPSESPIMGMKKTMSPTLQLLAHQVLHCPFQGVTRRLFMEGKALEVLACQLEEFSGERTPRTVSAGPDEVESLVQARNIVETEFADPPTLFDLARRVGLNDFKLKRGFKEQFGTTVFGHIRKLRMERARLLLESGNMTVTEVALETGYRHLGHFSAAFKRSFGVLPGRMRKARTVPSKNQSKGLSNERPS